MKKLTKLHSLLFCGLAALTVLASCQKQSSLTSTDDSAFANAIQVSLAGTTTIATTALNGTITTTPITTTGIFIIKCYKNGDKKDSVTFASLPTAIGTYLTANYAGYTFQKAFKISTAAGAIDSYAVVINFNGKPVGLKFDASGNFVLVFEQREGHDLNDDKGWHKGGCFGNRDGEHHDTLAVTALPATIKTYFATNYPTDTLLHAAVNFDATYVVISTNKGLFATAFTSGGTFITRVQLFPHPEKHTTIAQSALPATVSTYLTGTYPAYVFNKAFVEKSSTGTVQGYVVLITANNTRIAVAFDATGTFVKNVVLR
ncbi:PepSY-like domain-containing protein [Mucilaginibacter sp. HMF5004]|uniref:PepSY-like domain-containing protein n=1 Tax=Mucilaginibacter rivuli TaxID=2857527 RepID=UPI001C5DE3A0|nr:PepSY-like domain-containing protein [Mucilaginibacter rivuli]MBW4890646.1 PepSY-like domain-containing protein [Mucilaginibacter rivuli]